MAFPIHWLGQQCIMEPVGVVVLLLILVAEDNWSVNNEKIHNYCCKSCVSKKQADRRYRAAHPEKIRDMQRRWVENARNEKIKAFIIYRKARDIYHLFDFLFHGGSVLA